ncbi:MAG: magnesium/cobalt transporter CorA [Candidatus Margulisbacteria bacterium]|nr:magnesium/cobalt transporter CorA [Candidatus Margulisiibacteriota bacterium]
MIVNCVSYRQGKRVGNITIEAVSDVIKDPDCFIWLGLWEPDLELLEKIQTEFGLHELVIEDAKNAHQRPKLETYGDSLFLVLKTAELEKGAIAYGETHIFIGINFLITIRHGASSTYAGVRERCEHQPAMLSKGAGFVLYTLIDFIVDHYFPIINHYEEEFERLETDIFKNRFTGNTMEELYDLKNNLLRLKNMVLPVNDICTQLMRFHEELISKDLRVYFRDIQDHTHKIIDLSDGMREMLTTAMQVHLALVAARQNDIVKRLAGWGAILAIPTLIFSLYGMNFRLMPELQWHYGYPAVLTLTLLCCMGLYFKLKRSDWL